MQRTQPRVAQSIILDLLRNKDVHFLKRFLEDTSLSMGPLIPLFWTSGDVCYGFQSQGGFLTCVLCHLHITDSKDSL